MVFKIRTLSLPKPRTKEDLLTVNSSLVQRFSWRELKAATNNFSDKNVVGRGGSGKVYRGQLPDGSVVAVKRIKEVRTSRDDLEFRSEVEIGGNPLVPDHRNVIRLRGYCTSRMERLLVYPFMVNRSVASRLRERQPLEPPLDWPTRKKIALGAAKGLAHLHSGSCFKIIHRDVKAANILLDDQFEPVLCDFGLAKVVGRRDLNQKQDELPSNWGWVEEEEAEEEEEDPFGQEDSDHDMNCFTTSCWSFTKTMTNQKMMTTVSWPCCQSTKSEVKAQNVLVVVPQNRRGNEGQTHRDFTHVSTQVCGTMGHIAPEYFATGKCSVKNDVFGYGVMLLELITRHKACDLGRLVKKKDMALYYWLEGLVGDDKLDLVVDSNLRGEYMEEEMEQLLQLALLCTRSNPMVWPVMSEVIKILENWYDYKWKHNIIASSDGNLASAK